VFRGRCYDSVKRVTFSQAVFLSSALFCFQHQGLPLYL
jgi:hypothetical protein